MVPPQRRTHVLRDSAYPHDLVVALVTVRGAAERAVASVEARSSLPLTLPPPLSRRACLGALVGGYGGGVAEDAAADGAREVLPALATASAPLPPRRCLRTPMAARLARRARSRSMRVCVF